MATSDLQETKLDAKSQTRVHDKHDPTLANHPSFVSNAIPVPEKRRKKVPFIVSYKLVCPINAAK
jgi:hypothetical protein